MGILGISRTPDQHFRCFYSCEIILSHIPIPALRKDKNGKPHAGGTSIRDVSVLLK